MSEKQAKLERQEARKVVVEYKIEVLSDGNVSISGDLDNFLLFRDVMNKAERAVLERIAAGIKNRVNNRIVVPNLGIKGLKIAGGL